MMLLTSIILFHCKQNTKNDTVAGQLVTADENKLIKKDSIDIKLTTMPKKNNHHGDQGAGKKAAHAKSAVPENEAVSGEHRMEEKVVGIGMPVSKAEMDRLKEKAKKADH